MNSRLVRVFISSTFRDFIQERDELVKKVFPELRRRCKERFVELLEVDLRWGITEEQAKGGETLRICLEEIDRCRPSAPVFFIGLLGERYGWIPPEDFYTKEILEDPNLGWVREHIEGKSVTELEILHGVLRNEAMREKAFFYFRNDGYQERHWPQIENHRRAIVPPVTKEDFTNEKSEHGKAEDDRKQRELKQAIRDASLAWDPRNYEAPEDMGRMVLEDLWAAIDRVFPEGEVPDEAERHRLEHDAFGQSRTKGYVQREGLFEKLDTVLLGDGPSILAVTGESGGGKSALLAAWLSQLGSRSPLRKFIHYIGGTPESSTARSIVLRLMNEMRAWGAVADPVPDDFGQAVEALPVWLAHAAQGQEGGVLIVLDALNQLESERDRTLWWLPKDLPAGVHLVVSTLPGECEEELKRRGWLANELSVPPLNNKERRQIIGDYLGRFTKKLAISLVDRLAGAPQASNPLFLRVVLDELRVRARHEELGPMLDKMLEARDPSELFVQVLKSLEEFDKERPNLVRESMGLLAVARRGLSEDELLQLLSSDPSPSSNPLPRHYWSPLYLALEDSLVSRNGQLSFFHDYLRQAVEKEYLDEEWERKKVHGRLGDVAEAHGSSHFSPALRRYSLAHGTWHLCQAADRERLWSILSNARFRRSQQEEFRRLDEVVDALRDGIDFFAARNGQAVDDDPKLAWLMLCCGDSTQEGRGTVGQVFRDFRNRPSNDSLSLNAALLKLQILDEQPFFHAVQLLFAAEVQRAHSEGKELSQALQRQLMEALKSRVPAGTQVSVGGIDRYLAEHLRPDTFKEMAELTFEKDWRFSLLVEGLASKGKWDAALALASEIEEELDRSRGLLAIANALSENDVAPEQRKQIVDMLFKALEGFGNAPSKSRAAYSLIKVLASFAGADTASEYFDHAVELTEELQDPKDEAEATAEIATQIALRGADAQEIDGLFARSFVLAESIADANQRDHALQTIIAQKLRAGRFDQMLEQVARIAGPEMRVTAFSNAASTAYSGGERELSEKLLAKALDVGRSRKSADDVRASVWAQVAAKGAEMGNLEATDRALSLARERIAKSEHFFSERLTCAEALAESSLDSECATFTHEALADGAKHLNPLHAAQYLSNLAASLFRTQRHDLAEIAADATASAIGRIPERKWRSDAWFYHSSSLATVGGCIPEAAEAFGRGIEAAASVDDDALDWPNILSSLAASAKEGGFADLSLALFDRAIAAAQTVDSRSWRDRAFGLIAMKAARVGEIETALQVAGEVQSSGWLSRVLIQICSRLAGARGAANTRRHLASLSTLAKRIEEPDAKAAALARIAKTKFEVGDKAGAKRMLPAFEEIIEGATSKEQETRARLSYARALSWLGEQPQAIDRIERVMAPANELESDSQAQYALEQSLLCFVDIGEEDRAAGEVLSDDQRCSASLRTHAQVASALSRSGGSQKAKTLFDAAGKKARHFEDYMTILGEFAKADLAGALEIAASTEDAERRCKALTECLEADTNWSQAFTIMPHLQRALSDAKSLHVEDQPDWLGSLAKVVLRRGIPCEQILAAGFRNAAKSEKAFDFLITMDFDECNPSIALPWIRCFATMCPTRAVISKRLSCELVSAHLRAGHLEQAHQVAASYPELNLTQEVPS
jgi:hypothetical protein